MSGLIVVLALLFGTLTVPAPTAQAASAREPVRVDLAIEQYTLPNGLEVILHKDDRLPVAAVNLWYHVGAVNEAPDQAGFAHLFEHLMFEGSGHVTEGQFDKLLEAAGSSNNASTGYDYTNYVIPTVSSNQLELALWLEADRMGFLLDAVNETSLANQQAVARNERRGDENTPYGLVFGELVQRLFPEGHPYRGAIIGSHEDIQSATLDEVRAFHRTYYVPNNATLAVAGNIDVDQTRRWIEKYFGTIPRGADVADPDVDTPPLTAEVRAVVEDEVEFDHVTMAWLTPTAYRPGDAEASVAAHILGASAASRLDRAMVQGSDLAQFVAAQQDSLSEASIFSVTALAKPGRTAAELEAAMQAEIDRMATSDPTDDEVRIAVASLTAETVKGLADLGEFGGRADKLNHYNHYTGDPGYLEKDLARYADVTPSQVREFVATHLRSDRRVVLHTVPGKQQLPPDPPAPDAPPENDAERPASGEPWRNEVPPPGPEPSTAVPPVERFDLGNGLPVLWAPDHSLPIVTAALTSRSGSAADPSRLPGLAKLTTSLLLQGTVHRPALQVAVDAEGLGASLGAETERDSSTVTIQALTRSGPEAVALMAETVRSPAFAPESFASLVDNHRAEISGRYEDPDAAAGTVMWSNLYGHEHPYGHDELGTDDGLGRITLRDVKSFHRRAYTPDNSALVLTGDLTRAQARDLAEQTFGTWRGRGQRPDVPDGPDPVDERVLIVDQPGAGQTTLVAAQPGVSRDDPDYEPLQVMNLVLGGFFSSRLNTNLRETRGYTYGASSRIGVNRGVGPIIAGAAVESSVTGASVEEILHEVEAMHDSGVTDEELARAKAFRSRARSFRFADGAETANTLRDLFVFDLPLDYWESLPARLAPLTAGDIYEVSRKHLEPETMKIIAVGDRETIEPQLTKLNLGPVGYRTPDGHPAK